MRKIFATIIALAALVGCNTEAVDEVISTPAYLTTTFEVALDGDTRSFDSELNWSWESTDKIAAYQADGVNNFLNKLTLNQDNNFGSEEFKYTTAEQSTFVFVYPYDAFISTDKVGYVQTGVWTPTLVGTTSGTIDNLGTVTMVHASAAFEIRVWDEGRQARKSISAATISSTEDFCNATTATVSGLNSDTVVFNIAEGTFPFDITLTATDGKTYTVSKELTFELGKRTVLNVEWKYPSVSLLAYSSYNESDGDVIKNDGLSGNTIYVKDVVTKNVDSADIASIKLLLNNSESVDITNGSGTANGLAYGQYNVGAKLTTKNGATYTYSFGTVYVTGIPYHADWRSKDYSDWKYNSCADKGAYVRIDCVSSRWGGYVEGGVISPEFGIPANGLSVYTSVAASTRSTNASESDRCYIKAGTRSSTHAMSGDFVYIYYSANDSTYPDTALVALDSPISLTTSNRCLVYSGETYRIPVVGTNLYTYFYQIKITYNKQ